MNLPKHARHFLRAAIKLKDVYDKHDPIPHPMGPLPQDRWAQILRTERQLHKASHYGFKHAARRCRERLGGQLQMLQQELSSCDTQLRSMPTRETPKPSLKTLYEELISLAQEFLEVDVDRVRKEIVVRTERIVLEETDLGRFEIQLSIPDVREILPFRIVALDPKTPISDDTVSHPHVQSENLCVGDGLHAINRALAEGRLCDFFLTARQILRTYNSASAYVDLEDWNGVHCGDCGDTVDSDDCNSCEQCHGQVCDHCTRRCQDCDVSLCSECAEACEDCDQSYCRVCLQSCQECESETCHSCLENDLCQNCHTLQQEQNDAEPEDTSTDTPSPETPSEKTLPTLETSHTAIQPVCLGETAIPA